MIYMISYFNESNGVIFFVFNWELFKIFLSLLLVIECFFDYEVWLD